MHPISAAFIINLATLILKILGYIDTRSSALLADVFNDISDSVGLFFLMIGLHLSKRKKASIAYPFGMSRASYVFGLISISIFSGSLFTLSIIRSISRLIGVNDVITSGGMAIGFVLPALALNGLNMVISTTFYIYKKSADPVALGTLVDGVSDFISTLLASIAVVTLNSIVDGLSGLAVSIILLISAISLGYRYFVILIGRAPPKSELLKILQSVLNIPRVIDVNELKAIMITEDEYLVILEIETDENIDVEDLENLSQKIEAEIKKVVHRVKHVVIEFVPKRREPPTYRRILDEIHRLPK